MDPADLDHLRRHSGLRIDRAGSWWFRGQLVENPKVQRLFHSGLQSTDEGLVLRVGEQWAYVEQVDDTAFFVERLDAQGLRLLSGETLHWRGAQLASDADGVVATLSDGRRARLQRLAVLDLAPLLDDDGCLRTHVGLIALEDLTRPLDDHTGAAGPAGAA